MLDATAPANAAVSLGAPGRKVVRRSATSVRRERHHGVISALTVVHALLPHPETSQ